MKRPMFLGGVLLALSFSMALLGVAAAQQTVTVPINPVGGSGVSGTATLTAMDGTTQVSLSVSGFDPNTSHATHIHVGTCANPGGIEIGLPVLTADATGSASASAVVNASLSSLMDGNHIIQTHVTEPPNFGAAIACGDIPAVAGVAATPAATPAPVVTPAPTAAPVVTPAPTPVPIAQPGVAGGPAPLAAAAVLGALGFFALGGGLLLRRR